jgi:hypothetical protein
MTRRIGSIMTVVLVAVAALIVPAGPAQAADPSTTFFVGNVGAAEGDFIWYNRSVRVGGGVTAAPTGDPCAAVVFTAYDGSGRQVDRAARPGDNLYNCSPDRYGYGFTLDASDVVGGIRKIRVDLWEWYPDEGWIFDSVTKYYTRP